MGIEIIRSTNPEAHELNERYTLVPLCELDLERTKDLPLDELGPETRKYLETYFNLLTHPDNIQHFSSPPVDAADLRRKLLNDKTHAYIAENMLGEVVGAGGINDAASGEHDHFLVKMVVDPNLQTKVDDPSTHGKHVGRQLAIQLIDKAFFTRASDSRMRFKLDAAIIEGVPGWERIPYLLESLGFHFRSRLPGQVDVYDPRLQRTIRRPTVRWEIERHEWMRVRRRQDVQRFMPAT